MSQRRGRKPLLGTKKFKPITMGPSFAVEGGLLREPYCVTLEGPGKKYVVDMKKSPWLCMAAAGVTYFKSPLHRTKLVDIFIDVMNASPDEVSLGVQGRERRRRMREQETQRVRRFSDTVRS